MTNCAITAAVRRSEDPGRLFCGCIISHHRYVGNCKPKVDNSKRLAYTTSVIRNFRSRPLKKFANDGDASRLPVQGAAAVERLTDQLVALDAATTADAMNVPGWYFHSLRGKPARYSVRVTGNYRLTYGFDAPDAIDVDLEDYHGK